MMQFPTRFFVLLLVSAAITVTMGCTDQSVSSDGAGDAPSDSASQDTTGSESDTARGLVETKCSMCHSLDRVWGADKSAEDWAATVQRMKANGLVLTAEEERQITGYLAENR